MSDTDKEESYDSKGFAVVGDSDDEPPKNFNLFEELHEQVEIFLNLQKAQDKFQDYFRFESWESPQRYVLYRDISFHNLYLLAINTSFSCRFGVRGVSWLWDMGNLYPYSTVQDAIDAVR